MHRPAAATARGFASRGALLFLVRVLPALAALVVMLYLSRRLDRTEYGIYQNFWVRYALLSTVTCLGLPAFFWVLPPERLLGWLRSLRPLAVGVYGAGVVGLGLLFGFWQQPVFPVWLPALFLVVYTGSTLLEGVLLAVGEYRIPLLCSAVFTALFILLHLIWWYDPIFTSGLFLLLLLLGGGRTLLLLLACRPLFRSVAEAAPLQADDRRLWAHLGLYDLLQQGIRVADKFLVSFLVTPALSAVYFNGAQEVPFLPVLLGAASGVLMQQVAAGAEASGSLRWVQLTGRLLSSLVFPLFWWLLLFRVDLFAVVFSSRYSASAPVFAMAVLVLPLRAYPFTALLQHHRRGDLINAGAVLDLVLAAALAPVGYYLLGLPGVALAFSIATFGLALFYVLATRKVTGMPVAQLLPWQNWGWKLLLTGAVLWGVGLGTARWGNPAGRLFLGGGAALVLAVVALRNDLKQFSSRYGKNSPHERR